MAFLCSSLLDTEGKVSDLYPDTSHSTGFFIDKNGGLKDQITGLASRGHLWKPPFSKSIPFIIFYAATEHL